MRTQFKLHSIDTRSWIELREVLSPQLKTMYDNIQEYAQLLESSRLGIERGLAPPLTVRNQMMMLVERIMADILAIVRTQSSDGDAIKKFEESIADLKRKINKYKKEVFAISTVGAGATQAIERMQGYLESYTVFIQAIVVPILESIAKEGAEEIWEPMHKLVADTAIKRIGIKLDEGKPPFGRGDDD